MSNNNNLTFGQGSVSNQVYLSRNQIRNQVIEYLKNYLELENVDLTKSSFLSFIVNIISTLTSNLFFYQTSVYREFFLTKAQLPESIYNLSAFLGYRPQSAINSVANILVTIPFGFQDSDTTFTIPEGFKFYADNIEFSTYYETTVNVINNSQVSISFNESGKLYDIPVEVDTTANNEFYFILPVKQYKTTTQEFQIDDDLQLYQFTSIDVPVTGKVSKIEVYVRDPGSNPSDSGLKYTDFDSLYLMTSDDYGFVSRISSVGRTIYFGNGLIGKQPMAGSTVIIHINETQGADGNVIAGSINKGERIYVTTDAGITQIVNYTATNTSSAISGADEESLQNVKNNAIASLTALGRLVTKNDYDNASAIIQDSPLADNSIAVLKRSDVVNNEIQLFTTLLFGNEVAPTNNIYYTVPNSTTFIPRQTEITFGAKQYYTLFDIVLDDVNTNATYQYTMDEVEQSPTLVESWSSNPYNIHANSLNVQKSGSDAVFNLSYYSTEPDFSSVSCTMLILQSSQTYTMTNVAGVGGGNFTVNISPYTDLPEGRLTCYFTFSNGSGLISQYSAIVIFRKDLKSFMMSNTVIDGTNVIIYDIPVIEKEYYDGIVARDFELQVLQTMLTSMDFTNYRMLTDFTNVKFCKTVGTLRNMNLNDITKTNVIDIINTLPVSPSLADRYIVNNGTHKNDIATCTDETSVTWSYITPNNDDIVYVENESQKYIFSDFGWIIPEFTIPLRIELEIFKQNTTDSSETEIVSDVKEAILEHFSSRFGPNISISRSEIIDIVQNVEGVDHCHLLSPRSNIFFNFDLDEMQTNDLLEYTPEYIYFTEDDIVVKIIS